MKKKKKYYAVRKGRKPGIYTSWEEAEKQVKGFSNPDYKGFENLQDAKAYMNGQEECVCPDLEEDTIIAYVDGSYSNGIYGSGVVICDKNGKHEYYFWGNEEKFKSSNNIPGEVFAAIFAMDYAHNRGAKKLLLKFDLEELEKWATEEYKTKKFVSRVYKYYYEFYRQKGLEVIFNKVKAHSGNFCNDRADKLAKLALNKESNIKWSPYRFKEILKEVEGYEKNTNIVVKISKEHFDLLEEFLKSVGYEVPKRITKGNNSIELKIKSLYMKEYLTLMYHITKNTLQIQGKAVDVFNYVQTFLTNFENYKKVLKQTYGITDNEYSKLEGELDRILGGAYNDSPEDLQKVLLTAYLCLKEANLIPYPDYSFYIIPAARALEAFIKKAFIVLKIADDRNIKKIGIFFTKNKANVFKLKPEYLEKCASRSVQEVIEKSYNFYFKYRHVHSHASPIPGHTSTISTKADANDIIMRAFDQIRELYNIFRK